MTDSTDKTVPVAPAVGPATAPQAAPVEPPQQSVGKTANPARMRKRHWGLGASFAGFVMIPLVLIMIYMWVIAQDQYGSVSGFTVRKEESNGASDLLGGLAQFTGSSVTSDGDILYEFILSRGMVQRIDSIVDLREHYAKNAWTDPVFALWSDASSEDLESYWRRIVRISYDQGSGLTEIRVLAFSPDMAQRINQEIIRESQQMINALNEQARDDAMRYALSDLEETVNRLKSAREELTAFRSRTQIVDPEEDIRGRLGVMNNLQQQLAEGLITYDLLLETTQPGDPRLSQASRRIEVIRDRISQERTAFVTGAVDSGAVGEDYPNLLAEYEGLIVDREFAEETYRVALTALDLARSKAERQSRYLATYVEPTLPETSEYPQRFVLVGLAGLFLILSWSTMALIYYSIRDRR